MSIKNFFVSKAEFRDNFQCEVTGFVMEMHTQARLKAETYFAQLDAKEKEEAAEKKETV
jgi:hypothetical protein